MFGGGNKIKLDPDLIDRVKKIAEVAGYASHEEFIVHVHREGARAVRGRAVRRGHHREAARAGLHQLSAPAPAP